MRDLSDEAREAYLSAHVGERYGAGVTDIRRLDRGVFSCRLQDGRHWIVRVFPSGRSPAQVEQDASLLRYLQRWNFPAERCGDVDPVSTVRGLGVLVTDFVDGVACPADAATLYKYGELLGRLAVLPVEDDSIACGVGALHHYSPGGGGLEDELAAAAGWLAALEGVVPDESRAGFETLRRMVAEADNCRDLPEAVIHPDAVLKNLLAAEGRGMVLIDWTGAGVGPRLVALALLIWSGALGAGGWSPELVDAAVAGYRTHIQLEAGELERLASVMRIRPLVFACWRFRHAVKSGRSPNGTEWWWPDDTLVETIAARARTALST